MISSVGLIHSIAPRRKLDKFIPDREIGQKLKYMNIPLVMGDSGTAEDGSDIEDCHEILEGDRLLFATVNTEEMSSLSFYVYNTEDLFLHHDVYVFSTILDSALVSDRMVALATCEPDILVYDAYTTFPILPQRLFTGHTDMVTGVKIHNGRFLSSSDDRSVIEWDLATGGIKMQRDHGFPIEKFDFNELHICVGGKNDVKINEDNIVLDAELENIKFIGENEVCILDTVGKVHVYDVRRTDKPVCTVQGHEGSAVAVDVYNDRLVTGGFDRKVKVWNRIGMGLEETHDKKSPVLAVSVDTDGRIFCGEENDSISYIKI